MISLVTRVIEQNYSVTEKAVQTPHLPELDGLVIC